VTDEESVGTVAGVTDDANGRRSFPHLEGRDLEGRVVALPDAFDGDRNVVIVAFRREHQTLVDSWVPWLEARAAADPGLRFYEVPTIGTKWSPARRVIDGGMAGAIRDPVVLRRTITVYTDVRRVTDGLGIESTGTVGLFLVDATGAVRWRGRGAFDAATAVRLGTALDRTAGRDGDAPGPERVRQFDFAFDRRTRPLLAALGVVPSTAHVTLDGDRLVARFGPWSCETTADNVVDVELTGPYRAHRAIGARASLVDRGLTFGTTTAGGVCLCFREPVRGLDPFGAVAHPGLTVTVADREGFAAAVRAAAGLT
jgi:hypothetical protein